MSVKIVFMVVEMKMLTRTMTNSNCTPPPRSALVRQGRLCFRNPPHHRIRRIRLQDPSSLSSGGFLSFDVCVCVHITVFVYFCIYVFVNLCFFLRDPCTLFYVGSTFCVIFLFLLLVVFVLRLLFLLCICVFDIFFCDHWSRLISIFMYLIYLFFSDQVSFQSWLYNQDWSLFISNKNVIKATIIRMTKLTDVHGEW